MQVETILAVLFLSIALSMDSFAVSITDGLIYRDINKKKATFIALVMGLMQGIMPLIGYWLVELVSYIVGESASANAGNILSLVVVYLAFALLIFLGIRMILEGVKELKKPKEEKKDKLFSYKEVLIMGVATSIDALATGVTLHAGMSNNLTIFLHVSIIVVVCFIISLLGVIFGSFFEKLFKGKTEICSFIGGAILILLAIWILLSHYLGI